MELSTNPTVKQRFGSKLKSVKISFKKILKRNNKQIDEGDP